MIHAFLYGLILAFGLIIPLGVQNIFVFNQGATQPKLKGAMPSVITAFLCDTLLILCAVLGLSVIILTIPWLKNIIFIVGILFLLYMGWITWNSTSHPDHDIKPLTPKYQVGFAFSASLLNPHALLDTMGVIGTSSLNFIGDEKWAYTFACIFVSFCWFLALAISGHYLKKRDKSGLGIRCINKISAIIIWGVAGYMAYVQLL